MGNYLVIITILLLLFLSSSSLVFGNEGLEQQIIRISPEDLEYPSIGLVLSGGGARGMAHIGVLKILEHNNIPIDYIGGTSFGALVAAFYASGCSPSQIEQIMKEIDWQKIISPPLERKQYYFYTRQERDKNIIRLQFKNWKIQFPSALSNMQKMRIKVAEYFTRANYISKNDFTKLHPPLFIVATNIINGVQKEFTQGNLIDALLASLAAPFVFPPVEIDTVLYLDGGLTNNLPVSVMKRKGVDKIIASNTSSFLRKKENLKSALGIGDQIINIMMKQRINQEMQLADVILRPASENLTNMEFEKVEQFIQLGENTTHNKIEQIRKLLYNSSIDTSFYIEKLMILTDNETPSDIPLLPEYNDYHYNEIISYLRNLKKHPAVKELCADLITTDSSSSTSSPIHQFTSSPVHQLQIEIEKNPILKEIEIRGNTIYTEQTLLKDIDKMTYLSPCSIKRIKKHIEEKYIQDGYILAYVDSFNINEGRVILHINEGKISNINIKGMDVSRSSIIRREIKTEINTIFNINQVREDIDRIYSTNLFNMVDFNVFPTDDGNVRIDYIVKEMPYGEIGIGANYNTQESSSAYFSVGYKNIFGTGNFSEIYTRFGEKNEFGIRFSSDRIFNTYLTQSLLINYQSGKDYVIGEKCQYKSGNLDYKIGVLDYKKLGIGTLTYQGKRAILRGSKITDKNLTISGLGFYFIYDGLDKMPYATQGLYRKFAYAFFNNSLKSDYDFSRFYLDNRLVYTMFHNFTFELGSRLVISDGNMPEIAYLQNNPSCDFFGYSRAKIFGEDYFYLSGILRILLKHFVNDPRDRLFLSIKYGFGDIKSFGNFESFVEDVKGFPHSGFAIGLEMGTNFGPVVLLYNKSKNEEFWYFSVGYQF